MSIKEPFFLLFIQFLSVAVLSLLASHVAMGNMPCQPYVVLNQETKQCGGFCSGDLYGTYQCELPEGWEKVRKVIMDLTEEEIRRRFPYIRPDGSVSYQAYGCQNFKGYEDIGRLDRMEQYCHRPEIPPRPDEGSSEECKAYKILISLNECIRSATNYDTIRRCPGKLYESETENFETGKLWKNKHIQSLKGQIAVSCGLGRPRSIPRGRAPTGDFFLEVRQKLARCAYPIIEGFGTEFNCKSRARSGNP